MRQIVGVCGMADIGDYLLDERDPRVKGHLDGLLAQHLQEQGHESASLAVRHGRWSPYEAPSQQRQLKGRVPRVPQWPVRHWQELGTQWLQPQDLAITDIGMCPGVLDLTQLGMEVLQSLHARAPQRPDPNLEPINLDF